MSTDVTAVEGDRDRFPGLASATATRALALVAVLALLVAVLQVLYHFIDVTGVPTTFVAVVVVTLLVATVASRLLPSWLAVALGVVLLAGGLAWYVEQIIGAPPWGALVVDTIELFLGRSLLHISGIHAWVLGVAPAPVFLTWYFAMRHNYVGAVLVAGGTLGFLVLTNDADAITTLTGVVAGTAALALGDMDRREEPVVRAETVITVVALMIVVPAVISVVPAGAGASGSITDDLFGEDDTLESSLMTDERIGIQGSISLSPEVRFTVESQAPEYWRVTGYDRYTGDGWARTGPLDAVDDGRFGSPEGETRTVRQTYRAETEIGRMPAAWKPVEVTGFDGQLLAARDGSIQPDAALEANDTYGVRSEVPAATPGQLNAAGTDYPDRLEERYTQLPSSTPDRVAERTATLTENAETSYQTARTVEQWLESNKNYSLSVRQPRGDVADSFLFEMDAGYCTYYATTMVTMLRSQDVPARFVTGYSTGERVSEDEWVVRGLNSHAWVEVYFPEHGWVTFDPTPAGARSDARTSSVDEAREQGEEDVDTTDTRDQIEEGEWTPTPTATPPPLTTVPEEGGDAGSPSGPDDIPTAPPGLIVDRNATDQGNATITPGGDGDGGGGGAGPRLPTRQQLTLGVVAIAGVAIGLRRTRAAKRAYRAVWLRYQPRADPASDVERAFQRTLYAVQRNTVRKRMPDETVREYFAAIDVDPKAERVAAIRERARYAGEVGEDDADQAVRLANELAR